MDGALTLVAGLVILVGVVGVAVPVLPGLPLVVAGVLLWALGARTAGAWVILGIAVALAVAGVVLKYLVPGRRLRAAQIPTLTTLAAVALAVVGFFLIPVLGAVLGFVLGIYLAELVRLRDPASAWPSTRHALKALGLGLGIELATALSIATTWLVGVATLT